MGNVCTNREDSPRESLRRYESQVALWREVVAKLADDAALVAECSKVYQDECNRLCLPHLAKKHWQQTTATFVNRISGGDLGSRDRIYRAVDASYLGPSDRHVSEATFAEFTRLALSLAEQDVRERIMRTEEKHGGSLIVGHTPSFHPSSVHCGPASVEAHTCVGGESVPYSAASAGTMPPAMSSFASASALGLPAADHSVGHPCATPVPGGPGAAVPMAVALAPHRLWSGAHPTALGGDCAGGPVPGTVDCDGPWQEACLNPSERRVSASGQHFTPVEQPTDFSESCKSGGAAEVESFSNVYVGATVGEMREAILAGSLVVSALDRNQKLQAKRLALNLSSRRISILRDDGLCDDSWELENLRGLTRGIEDWVLGGEPPPKSSAAFLIRPPGNPDGASQFLCVSFASDEHRDAALEVFAQLCGVPVGDASSAPAP